MVNQCGGQHTTSGAPRSCRMDSITPSLVRSPIQRSFGLSKAGRIKADVVAALRSNVSATALTALEDKGRERWAQTLHRRKLTFFTVLDQSTG